MIHGNYSLAIRNLEKIIKLTLSCNEMRSFASAYYLLGRCYLEKRGVTKNDLKYAEICLDQALQISQKFCMRTLENRIQILFKRKLQSQKVKIFSE